MLENRFRMKEGMTSMTDTMSRQRLTKSVGRSEEQFCITFLSW